MFYTRSNGVRVPATVVEFAPDGLVHLEYFRDAVKVVNRQCKVESISFAIPSADSLPPHFPYLVTHFTDAMPISSIGGALSDILFNPKYAGCVWKITVAVDHLGNIVWTCPVLPGTSADVKIWDTVITGAVRALCENAPKVAVRTNDRNRMQKEQMDSGDADWDAGSFRERLFATTDVLTMFMTCSLTSVLTDLPLH